MNNELEQYQNVRVQTDRHTFSPANSLVWGSLRLAPIRESELSESPVFSVASKLCGYEARKAYAVAIVVADRS